MGRDASVKTNLTKSSGGYDVNALPYIKYIEYSVEADYDTKIATIEAGLGYTWQTKANYTSTDGTKWMIVVKSDILSYFDGAEQATFIARPNAGFYNPTSGNPYSWT